MNRKCPVAILVFAFLLLRGVPAASGQVVISEIMYHPVEEAQFNPDGTPVLDLAEDVHEFLELHNPGVVPVALGGWQINGAVQFTFPAGAVMQAGEYLVVAKNPQRLAAVGAYGLVESQLYGPYAGQLSNTGETLQLKNLDGQTVEAVAYSAEFPWPISADGLGAKEEWTGLKPLTCQYRGRSLERVSFTHAPNDPANWLASPLPGNPSPGRPKAVSRSVPLPMVVVLQVVQHANGHPLIRSNQPVRLECAFSATNDLSTVRLEYFVDDLNVTNKVIATLDMAARPDQGEGTFRAVMPGKTNRSVVRFRLLADRGRGLEVVSPRADDPFRWHAFFVAPVRSTTNEAYDLFISRASLTRLSANLSDNPNNGYLPSTNAVPNAGHYPDWIELGNLTDQPQSLSGLSLTDDVLAPAKFLFPAGATIPARGYLVVWCDDAASAPGLHTGFKIDAVGETVVLYRATANGLELVDSITFGLQIADRSLGRFPDGSGAWTLTEPTPNATNQPQPLAPATGLRINEWLAASGAGADWLELYLL